jgi:hypothetical protein
LVRSAIKRAGAVIPVFERMQAAFYVEMAQQNLARMQALLAELEASS